MSLVMMEKINLFIIGTQKGGTTALADFLGKHPDIYMVDGKEAHVFDNPFLQDAGIDNIQCEYKPFLKAYQGQPVRCDATPVYMYFPEIPARLSHYNEDAKIIIILRDPAERALSQYHMERRRGDEHLPYPLALCAENSRLKKDNHPYLIGSAHRLFSYRTRGHYCKQLARIFSLFSPYQVLVLTNRELRQFHDETLDKVTNFLGIEKLMVAQESVFSGNYQPTLTERISTWLLKLYFLPEKVRLRYRYNIKL